MRGLYLVPFLVAACGSSGPADSQDFSVLLGTYQVQLVQAYRLNDDPTGSLGCRFFLGHNHCGTDTVGIGHYSGTLMLGQFTHVGASHTDVSADFSASVSITGVLFNDVSMCFGQAPACWAQTAGDPVAISQPVTVRAQWSPGDKYHLSVIDNLTAGSTEAGPAAVRVAWSVTPGASTFHDSTAAG